METGKPQGQQEMQPPDALDWQSWVTRWDRMQERYLVKRSERFKTIVGLIRDTQPSVRSVLDLGCGTGSLMLSVLSAFPGVECTGVDFDPTLLWLAKARLAGFGDRAAVILTDLRDIGWTRRVSPPFDAVISATALHWLSPDQLSDLYRQIARVIRPGGLFLNADHVGSEFPRIQQTWERHREEMREQSAPPGGDDWKGFWDDYSLALGLDVGEIHKRVVGGWEGGVEEGLPLAWHLDTLRQTGFIAVDCFWRCDCDAIYGGIA